MSVKQKTIESSRATDAFIDIPSPEGLEYLPYQRAGIAFAANRRGTLIADEMGLGKTIQAIGLANYVGANSILVICPASLKLNWKKEVEKWMVKPLDVGVASSKEHPAYCEVIIINFDILKRYRKQLRQRKWDVMIVDESHTIKNPNAQRTREVIGGRFKKSKEQLKNLKKRERKTFDLEPLTADKVVFLTGTPILNKPAEIWTACNFLDPATFNDQWTFWNRYCDYKKTRFGVDVGGRSNLEELQEKLRSSIMIRRLKKNVLKDLPDKFRQVIEIPVEESGLTTTERSEIKKQIKHEHEFMSKNKDKLDRFRAIVREAEKSGDMESYHRSLRRLKEGEKASIWELARIRKETALLKAPLMISHVKELLDSNNKIVVFAHHREVIEKLMRGLGSIAVQLTGADKDKDRQESVDRFQNDPEVRVFVGSIGAAGVGHTLTASSLVVFAELDWVPAKLIQGEDRCHRIGQTDSVLVQHFVLQGSIDASMADKIVDKQQMIDEALDKDALSEIAVIP